MARIRPLAAGILALVVLATAIAHGVRTDVVGPALADLHDVSDLQAAFNRDASHARLLILASPT